MEERKKTKLEKMSKKEKTSLAYALATNLAKYGKPQTPKNERQLTKGEMKKREKHMGKFKKAFSLEEIEQIKEELKNPKRADLNKDGELSSYEKKRGGAIEKAMQKEDLSQYKVGDKVEFKGKNYEITRIIDDRIYIKNLKYGGRPDSWVKAIDLKKSVKEDLDLGHEDNEPQMLKADLYRIAKYAVELYKMVDQFDIEGQEVDFPQWWQEKIILSKEAMVKAKHYLDSELQVDKIDSMLEDDKSGEEHKVLSTAELNKLAALPPTDPSFKKDRRHQRLVKK